MSATVHTQDCLEAKARQDVWVEKWPNYCRRCGGHGARNSYQPVPYGSTVISECVWDECADCLAVGLCPRCKYGTVPIPEVGYVSTCVDCGWNDESPDALPEWEYFCQEESEYAVPV